MSNSDWVEELYEFTMGNKTWRYTSADRNIGSYQKVPIGRDKVEQTQEEERNSLNIQCSLSLEMLRLYYGAPPSETNSLVIKGINSADQTSIIWLGRVTNVKFLEYSAEIHCEPIYTSLQRTGLRRLYQLSCPHILYGPDCRANKSSFKQNAIVETINGYNLLSSSFATKPDGYYAGGYVDWFHDTFLERRFIIAHAGSSIKLNMAFQNMNILEQVTVYAGCNHTIDQCSSKFNNVINYGGQPFYPKKNPMNGTPIF